MKLTITLEDEKVPGNIIELKTTVEELEAVTKKAGISAIRCLISRGIEELQKQNDELKLNGEI